MASLNVLVSGASGLIGTELVSQLEADGHTVVRLVRHEPQNASESQWSPADHTVDAAAIAAADAVINLSGASTGRLPWTANWKRQILRSRVDATTTLADAIAASATPPAVFLSGSAVGYYGSRPGEELTEQSSNGDGFLADVVAAWELAARLAAGSTRVVTFRTGIVVAEGGAFTPLGLLTRFGLGSRLGSGGQFWPWIALYDEAAAIRHLLTSSLSGPVNLAGPTPATSAEITHELATAMHRWDPWVVPEFAIKLLLQGAGDDLLLTDEKVTPSLLLADGFEFRHQTVSSAINAIWK